MWHVFHVLSHHPCIFAEAAVQTVCSSVRRVVGLLVGSGSPSCSLRTGLCHISFVNTVSPSVVGVFLLLTVCVAEQKHFHFDVLSLINLFYKNDVSDTAPKKPAPSPRSDLWLITLVEDAGSEAW